MQLPAQEGRYVLRLHRVDRGAGEGVIERGQVFRTAEDEGGGILDLHQAPVAGRLEVREHRAEWVRDAIQERVEALQRQATREFLGAGEVGDREESRGKPRKAWSLW